MQTPWASHHNYSSSTDSPLLLDFYIRNKLYLALCALLALHIIKPAPSIRDIGAVFGEVRPHRIQGVFVNALEVLRSRPAVAVRVAVDGASASELGIVGENFGEDRPHNGDRGKGEAKRRLEHAPDQRVRDRIGDVFVGDCDEGVQANDTNYNDSNARWNVSGRKMKCLGREVCDGVGLQKSDCEDAGEGNLTPQVYLQPPDHGQRKTEYKSVGDDVEGSGDNVGFDLVPARSFDRLIPVICEGPTQQEAA